MLSRNLGIEQNRFKVLDCAVAGGVGVRDDGVVGIHGDIGAERDAILLHANSSLMASGGRRFVGFGVLFSAAGSMAGDLGNGGGEVALVDATVAGEAACAVDQYLIPDAAGVAVDHLVLGEIEVSGKVTDDVLGIVRDAFGSVVVDDGDDVAIDGAAVNRAAVVF
jgi:hypothetical protein